MTKILILYVEAGHGHRKVAEAIEKELKSQAPSILDVQIFDALDKTNLFFRYFYPRTYYQFVIWVPWLWGLFYFLTNHPLIYFLIAPLRSLWNRLQSSALREHLKKERFDFILFTHFFPAEVCATAKRKGEINSKLITVVTDIIPHAVWQNPGTDHYWTMAEESLETLIKRGIPREQIFPNGIPVSDKFLSEHDRGALQNRLGLNRSRLTLLFTSGSFGIGPTEAVIDSFSDLRDQIQVIVVCGRNQVLLETLKHRSFPFPVLRLGFIENMHEIMTVADLLIAKPGGATMCESLVKKLPMIILAPIPGQESENAKWLIRHEAAFSIKKPSDIKNLISQILTHPDLLEKTRKLIEKIVKPKAASDLAHFILNQIRTS